MSPANKNLLKFNTTGQMLPQEEMLAVEKQKSIMTIGIPKETSYQEKRVGIAPEAVGTLIQNGHKVLIESDAGKAAHFTDNEYAEAGAQVVSDSTQVYQADIIVKVAPPMPDEIEKFKGRQTLISALHLTGQNVNYFKSLISKKVTAICFEQIKDKTKSFTIARSISEITGSTAIMIAAEYLSHPKYGRGSMLGGFSGITPSEVVIIGAGTVGEYAARTALGLGAMVKVFDNNLYKLRRLQNNLVTRIFTSILQPKVLAKSLQSAHVVIGAVYSADGCCPCIVNEEMVSKMKQGAVIVDVSIDQGGCFETSKPTTHDNPVYQKYGVTHYCVPNIPSRVPHTASYALSNFFAPMILQIGDEGGISNFLKDDPGIRNGVYLFNGILTNKYIGETFKMPYQDLDLLMAAFH